MNKVKENKFSRNVSPTDLLNIYLTGEILPKIFRCNCNSTIASKKAVSFWLAERAVISNSALVGIAEAYFTPVAEGIMTFDISSLDYDGEEDRMDYEIAEYITDQPVKITNLEIDNIWIEKFIEYQNDEFFGVYDMLDSFFDIYIDVNTDIDIEFWQGFIAWVISIDPVNTCDIAHISEIATLTEWS